MACRICLTIWLHCLNVLLPLLDRPANRKECHHLRPLHQPTLKRVDQLVALAHDLIFDLENLLPLAALLAFKFPHLHLDLALLH